MSERRSRYPVADVTSALAELDAHFGARADEALDAYLAHRDKIGQPIRSLGAFFARGIDGQLKARIASLLATPSPSATGQKCTACDGGGFELDPDSLNPIGPCPMCKPLAARKVATA